MELTDLVEQAIVGVFANDSLLSQFVAASSSSTVVDVATTALPPPNYLISVMAVDAGDFTQVPGMGIKLVDVEVTVTVNLGTASTAAGQTQTLSMLCERVDGLLGAAQHDPEGSDIISQFVAPGLLIYGITAQKPRQHSHIDLTRQRIITREFICTQTR